MNRNTKIEILRAYRELYSGKLIEHRSTFLSDVDQLAAIQLAVLLLQKKVVSNKMAKYNNKVHFEGNIIYSPQVFVFHLPVLFMPDTETLFGQKSK